MKDITTIADLNESPWLERLQLITDSEEIGEILAQAGLENDEYACIWTESADGELVNLFAAYAFPPRLDASVETLIAGGDFGGDSPAPRKEQGR